MILYTVLETDDLGWLHKEVNDLMTRNPQEGFTSWQLVGSMKPSTDAAGRTLYYQTLIRHVQHTEYSMHD